uniref:Peptide-methionine (R)-S-oxide reductase n=3 Tax=Meloidogyne TaxID=189290 RepID=A0A6V7Y2P5_MELEN|nr:unnamed protein product [Meloidogyne enterolobii]
MGLIALGKDSSRSEHQPLLSDERYSTLIQLFRLENDRIYKFCTQSPFSACLQAGIAVHKTPQCKKDSNSRCIVCGSVFELSEGLPYTHLSNSRLFCAISGELFDCEDNRPMMLPNGHVYGEKSMRKLAKNNEFVCPRTLTVYSLDDIQRKKILYMKRLNNIFFKFFNKMSTSKTNSPKSAFEKLGLNKNPKEVTEEEWKKVLTPEQFEITRKAGTELAFTGKYDKHFISGGKYVCICCGADLFVSENKFNSGCGWPAFSKSIEADKNITRLPDHSFGRIRTEVRCSVCNAHLGHVFDDGPQKDGGERYCINSESIDFVGSDDKKEEKN